MDETRWTQLKDPWTRLRWARLRWQNNAGGAATAKAAADSLNMQENTYSAYERPPGSSKHTDLDHQRAVQFARKFQTNWVWLLTGDETPFGRTEAQDRALKAMADAPADEQERIANAVEALARRAAG